jgi:hypothetical protein
LGFGALTLIYDDFGLDWQRVPEWVAARGTLAYAAGAIEVAAAAALLFRRTAALAAFALTPYTLLWVLLLDVPPLLPSLGVESAWLSVGERTELFAGVWILAITLARAQNTVTLRRFTDDRALRVARMVFGLALIPAGLFTRKPSHSFPRGFRFACSGSMRPGSGTLRRAWPSSFLYSRGSPPSWRPP